MAVTVAAGVPVTVGVALTGGVGAGVALGSGIGAGVTVGVGASVTVGVGAGVTVGVGAGVAVGAGFWARAGIHIRESATIDTWTELGRFMGFSSTVRWTGGDVSPPAVLKAMGQRGPRLVQETLFWRRRPQHSAQCLTVRYNP